MKKISLADLKISILENKFKILYSSIGYFLFIFDSEYYEGLVSIVNELDKLSFWFAYLLLIAISFFVTKYGLKFFKALKESKSFSSFFSFCSLGSLFGFITTLIVSFMQVSFLKF